MRKKDIVCWYLVNMKDEIDGKKLTEKVVPLGYVTLANPIRDKAKETFEYFAEQDVQIKVISGDNPMTVSEVAAQAGIAGAEHYVDASTLKTDEQVARAWRNTPYSAV